MEKPGLAIFEIIRKAGSLGFLERGHFCGIWPSVSEFRGWWVSEESHGGHCLFDFDDETS